MKSKARSFMWWPKMDDEIEYMVKSCQQCQLTRHSPIPVPCQSWDFPQKPWRRLHIDYAGPFHGKMFLLVVDAYSKWLEVAVVNSANAITTVEKLRGIFATHGLPNTLVSDNGAVFTSEEFETFTRKNGIKHIRTTPYHPSSNGQVERVVQVFKEGTERSGSGTLETKLNRFLFHYRTTPHTTTGLTPAELLMGRHIRTHLDLMHPDLTTEVHAKQQRQVTDRNKGTKDRTVAVGETVFVQDLPSWTPGVVKEKRGPQSYLIELSNGCMVRRHIDHLRHCEFMSEDSEAVVEHDDLDATMFPSGTGESLEDGVDHSPVEQSHPTQVEQQVAEPRRSTRVRNPPVRFAPYISPVH